MTRPLLVLFLLLALGCGSNNPGGRSLPRVRKDSAATRSRALLALEHGLVFPDCDARPGPTYACGLTATRRAEREIADRCGHDGSCSHQAYSALFARVQARADQLGIDLDAVDLRCGPPCRDLRELELEIIRTAHNNVSDHVHQALLRADSDEREALDRGNESTKEFEKDKGQRDARVNAIFEHHRRALDAAAREGTQSPHATLCSQPPGCADALPCLPFGRSALGLCARE